MKRILAMALSVLLIAGMAIGGSVAYLTGTDSDTNVFTMGDVEIEQHEYVRKDEATTTEAEAFDNEDGYLLLPAHGYNEDNTRNTENITVKFGTSEYTYGLWKTSDGARDKIVKVENTGKTAAYVRTVFAFEDTLGADSYIIKNWKDATKVEEVDGSVSINGELYKLYTYTYTADYANKLEPGATTDPSLMQVVMSQEAGNELVDAIAASNDGKYTIYVATQAVQAENMTGLNGDGALNAAFGEVTAVNNPWTRGETDIEDAADAGDVIRISSKADLNNLTDTLNGKQRATVILTKDIDFGDENLKTINVPIMNLVFDGNGHTISNAKIVENGMNRNGMTSLALFGMVNQNAKLTVKNLTLKGITVNGVPTGDVWAGSVGAAAVVGFQAADGVAANSVITLNNVDVYDSDITNEHGSASVFVGHAMGHVTMTDCDAYNCKIAGEAANKTGAFVGTITASGNVTINNCINNAKYNDASASEYGRKITTDDVTGQFNGTSTKVALAISTKEELKAFADKVNNSTKAGSFENQTVVLLADIDLKNEPWTPIGQWKHAFYGNFNGNGHTIKNLKVNSSVTEETSAYVGSGLFGWTDGGSTHNMTIENLTIDGAEINGGHNCGVLYGYISNSGANHGNAVTVKNCTVKNATVNCNCYKTTNDEHCGDKAGAIVGYLGGVTVQNCKAENVNITAGRDAGKLFGASTDLDIITGCSATDVNLVTDTNCTHSNKGGNMGSQKNGLVGRKV